MFDEVGTALAAGGREAGEGLPCAFAGCEQDKSKNFRVFIGQPSGLRFGQLAA